MPPRLKLIDQRDIIIISMLAVACFLIDSSLGIVLLAFSSVPLVGGLASSFFESALVYACANIVPRLGAATLFATLWLTMATVTPSFGPPGAWKILIGLFLGISAEVVLLILGRRPLGYIAAIAIGFALSIPVTYLAWARFGIPKAETLKGYLPLLTLIYGVLAVLGSLAGKYFFDQRLSKYSTVSKIINRESSLRV